MDQRRRFTRDDLEVLASVACQAAVAVENAQLHEVAVQEELLQRELVVAHKVQQGLLPAGPPVVAGYDFFDYYEPANQLGGDYFDYIPLQGGRIAVALADVSGKGISASLLMARLSAEVRYCLAMCSTPAEAMNRLNKVFCQNRWEDRFVTMALAVLDPLQHEVCLVNAGHLAPLVRRASGDVEPVGQTITAFPLGIEDEVEYKQCAVPLGSGDLLLMHTDGIPDAMNPAGEFYGAARLRAQIAAEATDASNLGRRILAEVRQFISTRPQTDDMCLTIFRRSAAPPTGDVRRTMPL
jgi:serine phosphatase RsbU (regulator of sigma subunit)